MLHNVLSDLVVLCLSHSLFRDRAQTIDNKRQAIMAACQRTGALNNATMNKEYFQLKKFD